MNAESTKHMMRMSTTENNKQVKTESEIEID